MTQYNGISVALIEQEAPNNLAIFKVKVLPVNVLRVSWQKYLKAS